MFLIYHVTLPGHGSNVLCDFMGGPGLQKLLLPCSENISKVQEKTCTMFYNNFINHRKKLHQILKMLKIYRKLQIKNVSKMLIDTKKNHALLFK